MLNEALDLYLLFLTMATWRYLYIIVPLLAGAVMITWIKTKRMEKRKRALTVIIAIVIMLAAICLAVMLIFIYWIFFSGFMADW